METLLIVNLSIILVLIVGLSIYCIYQIIVNKNQKLTSLWENFQNCENNMRVTKNISDLKDEIKSLEEQNKQYDKQIKLLKEDIDFLNNHSLNLYAEQNDCWSEIERLNNELETIEKHIVETDKLNLAKFNKVATLFKGGKND